LNSGFFWVSTRLGRRGQFRMVAFLDEDSEKLEKDNRPFFQLYKNCNLIGPPRSRDPLLTGQPCRSAFLLSLSSHSDKRVFFA